MPSLYGYWKINTIFHYSPAASGISCDRFFELHQYIHFTNNSTLSPLGDPSYDKLQPILKSVRKVLRSVYCPPQSMSRDEAMMLFKGRSTVKQYMPPQTSETKHKSVGNV
jgi:hypothetical protein